MWFNPGEYEKTNPSAIATFATTATIKPDNAGLSQKSQVSQPAELSSNNAIQSGNVATVADVATDLNADDRQTLLDHQAAIGETDQNMIDEYLSECASDSAKLTVQLQQAKDYLQITRGDTRGFVQCSGCMHLSGDQCPRHGWRVVVDKWRRCSDFEVLQKTPVSELITCKACSHFQSYHPHGGAGACGAGVQPFGACWWADTVHECEKHLIKAEV